VELSSGSDSRPHIMLFTTIRGTIKKYRMFLPGEKVLVAVSGGPDSVCLLNILQALQKDLDLTLHIAHLDHMFRGQESAAEALFVGELADTFGIPATIEKVDVPAYCHERRLSPQEGARAIRYDFLQHVARTINAARIATGHTADDQAETFLMRLLRGAGTSGLSAIPPVRENIVRPLIEITRDQVMEYLNWAGLSFVTDPSNTKPVYTRNRIRHEIIPVLKTFNPRIIETLATEATLLRDEDEAIDYYCATLADSILDRDEKDLFIRRTVFNLLPIAFRRRVLKKALDLSGMESSGMSLVQIDEVLAFMVSAQTGRIMNLPHGLSLLREYDRFVLNARSRTDNESYPINMPGVTVIPALLVKVETVITECPPMQSEDKNNDWQALFDYDKMGPFLTFRKRHPGDWFCPAGMGGKRKKLQDYFVDEKVPRRMRDTVPLLCSGVDILWVVGLRTDERFLPGPNTTKGLMVRIRMKK
jgi:tRNA(Ile)-lysidine synthase